jgi:hypothetical protein
MIEGQVTENRELPEVAFTAADLIPGPSESKGRKACGLQKPVCCHSFRATGIIEQNAGGALDIAQRIAGHSQLSTTKIYDRSEDRVTIVGLHGFAKGVFGGGGFFWGRHRAIRTRRAWLPSEKSTMFPRRSL